MIETAYWIPLLPLIGAALIGALGPRLLRGGSHWPAVLGVAGAALCSLLLFAEVRQASPESFPRTRLLYRWIHTGGADDPRTEPADESALTVSLAIDPLTAVMLVTVCVVSLLVVVYSRDYMRHEGRPERGYERFFAFLALFVFSMCTLVLAGNFLLLYLGWEAVGLCSYLLIGFYYRRPEAAAAARKAFLVNRIGDFGFGLGVVLIYWTFGTLEYETVFAAVRAAMNDHVEAVQSILRLSGPAAARETMDAIQGRLTLIALLLFCGAIGKSAQLPLYVWLPDAMEGPTPVSALIHAATMVTAGVYMVARCGAIFAASATAMAVVAVIGGLTALFAATIAVCQFDMKRILAYSTISQLAYMFLGLGCFAADAAIFHLYTHAFFKALLFLGAGSVMHAMGGIIDLRQFGGLRRALPVTFVTFFIGGLALAGFPLLAGFWSKDEIIHAAMLHRPMLGNLALLTAALTAFYTFRMIFVAFGGPQRVPPGVHAQEAGWWMKAPLVLLSAGAILAGYVGVTIQPGGFAGLFEPRGFFHEFLSPALTPFASAASAVGLEGHQAVEGDHQLMYVSAGLAVLGILAAYLGYIVAPRVAEMIAAKAPGAYRLLYRKYYVDEGYDAAVVRPLWGSARILDGVDRYVIDGLVWLATAIPRLLGFMLRTWQGGLLQGYAVVMVFGVVLMALWVLLRG